MEYEYSGERLAELRKRAGHSQMTLAKVLGINDRQISVWERSHRTPHISTVGKICSALGIAPTQLFEPVGS